jgi:hypothetical protein
MCGVMSLSFMRLLWRQSQNGQDYSRIGAIIVGAD